MLTIIENLQNKSEPAKHLIMWSGVVFIMAIIFTFWLVTFPSQIPPSGNDEAANKIKTELPGIWEGLKGQFNNLKNVGNLWQK